MAYRLDREVLLLSGRQAANAALNQLPSGHKSSLGLIPDSSARLTARLISRVMMFAPMEKEAGICALKGDYSAAACGSSKSGYVAHGARALPSAAALMCLAWIALTPLSASTMA